jgi:hypothetical protein
MSALRESLEGQGQNFVTVNLEPLSRQRQFWERQDRILQLQLKWANRLCDKVSSEMVFSGYNSELEELTETFALAYQDYLAQRLDAPVSERF